MVDFPTKQELAIIQLFCNNYHKQTHIREMASTLNTSHVTLLPHLSSLEKKRILDSQIKGRNKLYFLNLTNINTKLHLTCAENALACDILIKNFTLLQLTHHIVELGLYGSLILFGSYAKGIENKRSDIDLYYVGSVYQKHIQNIRKYSYIIQKEIHFHSSTVRKFEQLLRKNDVLAREVVKNHIILNNPDVFVSTLWKMYKVKPFTSS